LDIRNSYYGYPEKLFQISEINVSFWISKIVILDIRNNNSGYAKQSISPSLFLISKILILDIQNNYFGYPK